MNTDDERLESLIRWNDPFSGQIMFELRYVARKLCRSSWERSEFVADVDFAIRGMPFVTESAF